MNNFVWDELKFYISRLSALRVSETLRLNDEALCVYTGTYFENMIYDPDCVSDSESVSRAMDFFRERDSSFMWFVRTSKPREHSDLKYAGDLTAMTLESNHKPKYESNPEVEVMRIDSHSDSALWANTVWRSFGYEGEVHDNYYEFVDSLIDDRENLSLYLAMHEGKPSGTVMTTRVGGVYYVGVVPEKRRKGIGREMLNEICRHNTRLVLQATPEGYALYKSFGFTECFKIPVYSTESDVF